MTLRHLISQFSQDNLYRRERIWGRRGGWWRVAASGVGLLMLPVMVAELIVTVTCLACCVAWWKLRGRR